MQRQHPIDSTLTQRTMPTTSTTGPGPVHRIDQAIEAPNVGMLLKRIEQIYHPSARLTDEALAGLSIIELQAFCVWLALRRGHTTKPVDRLTKDALTVLVALGADTGYDFDAGSQRIVIIGAESVWNLAMNPDGEATSNLEAAAAIAAPVAPARWTYVAGVRVLEMERVTVVEPDDLTDEELLANPWWTDVDGWTLGRRRTGQLVVFDAGQFGPAHRAYLPDRYRHRIAPTRSS